MFLRKYIDKNFATKDEIENVTSKIVRLEGRINALSKENESLKRILKFYAHGDLFGFSENAKLFEWNGYRLVCKTYVYKNGEEYIFDGLYIENPNFTQGNKENVVYASSGDGKYRYVLDLYNNAFIEIETKESENENEPR